jgi:hypothetical protein
VVLDRVGQAVRDAEPEEGPHPARRISGRAPDVLVEVVVDRPRLALLLQRRHREQELGEEALKDPPEDRSGILQTRKHNISRSGGSEGLGFVVTLNTAKRLVFERRSFWSGLEGLMLSDELANLLNVPPKTTGYIVKPVVKDSPADHLGLRGSSQMAR